MPDHIVTDEKGVKHHFPDEATPEMIAKALNVKPPAQAASPPPAKPPGLLGRAEKWWTTPSEDLPPLGKGGTHAPGEAAPAPTYSTPQERTGRAGLAVSAMGAPIALVAAPGAALLGLAGGTGGGYLGGEAGEYLGEKVGAPQLGRDLGGFGGSVLGGTIGGMAARPLGNATASFLRNPATAAQSELGRPGSVKDILPPQLQRWTLPPWMIPKGELGTPTNPGQFNKIPPKLPPNLRGDPFNPESSSARKSVLGNKGVGVYPEPREPLPGDRPGAAWSQGREKTLPASAARGAPGAVDVLRNIGKPMVLTPRSGVGYPAPGEFESIRTPLLSPEAAPAPQVPTQPEGVYEPGEREGYLESIIRGAPGENPSYKSLLRNLQKTRKPPIF